MFCLANQARQASLGQGLGMDSQAHEWKRGRPQNDVKDFPWAGALVSYMPPPNIVVMG